jgi:PhnB protein
MFAIAEEDKNLIMHIELPITGGHLLKATNASQSMGFQVNCGNVDHLNIEPDSKSEMKRLFYALSEGDTVTM